MKHDQLQYQCHTWLWNEHPELRYLFHANFNNLSTEDLGDTDKVKKIKDLFDSGKPSLDKIKAIINFDFGTTKATMKMARLKSIGLVRGVLDYEFFYNGQLYFFDFKVGNDKLSKSQLEFIRFTERQGAKCYEIRSLDQFQQIINAIIN